MRTESTLVMTQVRSRPWVGTALACVALGGLWGLAEATLGQGLHARQVPLAGQVMIPIGIACALAARRLCPSPGIVAATGALAACVRAAAPGPFLLMPSLAILVEASLMEACVGLAGSRRPAAFALAGAAAAAYPFLHAFVIKSLFFGMPLAVLYAGVVNQARTALATPTMPDVAAVLLWAVLGLGVGALTGLAARAVPSPAASDGKAS